MGALADRKSSSIRLLFLLFGWCSPLAAAAFLEMVAADEIPEDRYTVSIPQSAVIGLAQLGEPGRSALSRLAAEDRVSDGAGRAQLQRELKPDGR